MGNSLATNRFQTDIQEAVIKKSRNLREYTRKSSLITSCIHPQQSRRKSSLSKQISTPPTDGDIIEIHSEHSDKQMEYIRSCVRKDKGLFGSMTENLQNKHIFSNDEPENTHILDQTPEDYNMNYQSMYLKTIDGEYLHAYWIYQIEDHSSIQTVLYFHGAGGNVSHRLEVLRLFYENLRCNILIIDYRGFGKSSGTPSELGLYIDAQTAYDYLIYKQNIAYENLIILGTSLGASIAIQLVSDPLNRCQLAIFENAFISIPEIAKYFLKYGKTVLEKMKSISFIYLFDSLTKVSRIQCSCMYLTGLLDPLIPSWMTNTLYNQTILSKKCQLFEYPFGKHNDLPIMNNYFENIQNFLQDVPKDK